MLETLPKFIAVSQENLLQSLNALPASQAPSVFVKLVHEFLETFEHLEAMQFKLSYKYICAHHDLLAEEQRQIPIFADCFQRWNSGDHAVPEDTDILMPFACLRLIMDHPFEKDPAAAVQAFTPTAVQLTRMSAAQLADAALGQSLRVHDDCEIPQALQAAFGSTMTYHTLVCNLLQFLDNLVVAVFRTRTDLPAHLLWCRAYSRLTDPKFRIRVSGPQVALSPDGDLPTFRHIPTSFLNDHLIPREQTLNQFVNGTNNATLETGLYARLRQQYFTADAYRIVDFSKTVPATELIRLLEDLRERPLADGRTLPRLSVIFDNQEVSEALGSFFRSESFESSASKRQMVLELFASASALAYFLPEPALRSCVTRITTELKKLSDAADTIFTKLDTPSIISALHWPTLLFFGAAVSTTDALTALEAEIPDMYDNTFDSWLDAHTARIKNYRELAGSLDSWTALLDNKRLRRSIELGLMTTPTQLDEALNLSTLLKKNQVHRL